MTPTTPAALAILAALGLGLGATVPTGTAAYDAAVAVIAPTTTDTARHSIEYLAARGMK